MFNFERIVHKMSLIHDLTEFCDQEYKPHCQNDPCLDCTHPSGKCRDLVLSVRSKSTIIQKVGDLYITVKIISITTQ